MKVVTWNVNSVQVRLERLMRLIDREEPEIVCLQELKCTEDKFPFSALQEKGFESLVIGQKTYNGVAILTQKKPSKVWKSLTGSVSEEARFVSAKFGELTVVCVYVPNGQEVGSEKYRYKLAWFKDLHAFLKKEVDSAGPVLICGDFNVAPRDEDVYDVSVWKDQILFSDQEKKALQSITDLGFSDLYPLQHPKEEGFTWWDYRNFGFPKNHGLRIDLFLGSQTIVDQLDEVYVDRHERKGVQPSDHAPVICVLKKNFLR